MIVNIESLDIRKYATYLWHTPKKEKGETNNVGDVPHTALGHGSGNAGDESSAWMAMARDARAKPAHGQASQGPRHCRPAWPWPGHSAEDQMLSVGATSTPWRCRHDRRSWWVAAGTLAFPGIASAVGERRAMPDDWKPYASTSEMRMRLLIRPLRLVAGDPDATDLARVGDVRPAVGLEVEPDDLDRPDLLDPLGQQVDLGPDRGRGWRTPRRVAARSPGRRGPPPARR